MSDIQAVFALIEIEDLLKKANRSPIRDKKHEDAVRALGDKIGYGSLMSIAQYLWRDKLPFPGGEFVAGPCRSTVEAALELIPVIRRALLQGKEGAALDMMDSIIQDMPEPDSEALSAMRVVIAQERSFRRFLGLYGKPTKQRMPLAKWLSAALESDMVCQEMKRDIQDWFDAGEPGPAEDADQLIDRGIGKTIGFDFGKQGGDFSAHVEMKRNNDGTWRVVKIKTERHGG